MFSSNRYAFSITTISQGFFRGFIRPVSLGTVLIVGALSLWIVLAPDHAARLLNQTRVALMEQVRGWYMYVLFAFAILSLALAFSPAAGRKRLSSDGEGPEFSRASWLSMMFCSGIGAGIVIYAVAEPMSHFTTNPEFLGGTLDPGSEEAAIAALKYTFMHWGITAWATYSVVGLGIAFFAYRYDLPLTIRSALAPILGRHLSGPVGVAVDIFSIVAIITGIATTMGYGVATLSSGVGRISGISFFADADGVPKLTALLLILALSAGIAVASVVSGVGKGVKWLLNGGTALFFVMMLFFGLSASTDFLGRVVPPAIWDYVAQYPAMSLAVYGEGDDLSRWQTDWTIFYWAWWIAFAPFVGLFIARISKGRTVREFILGSALAPCGICFVWFGFVGGAAMELELADAESHALLGQTATVQLYSAIQQVNGPLIGQVFSIAAAVLILLLSTTTFASGVLAITTVTAAGDHTNTPAKHVLMWSALLALIIGGLLVAGGTDAIRDAMIISALPFSVIVALVGVSATLGLFLTRDDPKSLPAIAETV